MKVIIEHDDYCPQSPKGKDRWLRSFEEMRVKTGRGFDAVTTMQALVQEWAELGRRSSECTCGAATEIKRRIEESEELRVSAETE